MNIWLITFAFLFITAFPGFLEYRRETAHLRAGRLYSFPVDWVTFLAVGFVLTFVTMLTRKGRKRSWEQFQKRKKFVNWALLAFMLGFWLLAEIPAYFNLMGHPFHAGVSGNEFMWNGYIEFLGWHLYDGPFPTYHEWWSWPVLIGNLLLQAGCLWLGREFGYMQAFVSDTDRWTTPAPEKK